MDLEKLNEEYIFQYLPEDYSILMVSPKDTVTINCFPMLSIKEGLTIAKKYNSKLDYDSNNLNAKNVRDYLKSII